MSSRVPVPDELKAFIRLRGTMRLYLAEHDLGMNPNLENSSTGTHQLSLQARRFLDNRRQTGSPEEVVSDSTILDDDFHS